jgi:hypothetical protein
VAVAAGGDAVIDGDFDAACELPNQPMDNRVFISIRRDMGSKACHLVAGIQHFCHRVKLSTHYNSMTCNNGCGLNMQQRGNNSFSTMIGF